MKLLKEGLSMFLVITMFSIMVVALNALTPVPQQQLISSTNEEQAVLGESDTVYPEIYEVYDTSSKILTHKQLTRIDQNQYQYTATIIPHRAGVYSVSILSIKTPQEEDFIFEVANPEDISSDLILVISGADNYTIDLNTLPFAKLTLPANTETEVFLKINDSSDVFFSQNLELNIINR